jgi:Ca-activated chloride channel family protein
MHSILVILFLLCLCAICDGQSGRVKQIPEDTAKDTRPRSVKDKTHSKNVAALPVPSPTPASTPAPTPKPTPASDDDDVISVNSILIPIPASITDETGKAVTTLQLKDFDLFVDDKPAEIADLSHSDAPVRMALLFDNSSSLTTARDFELKAATRFLRRILRPGKDQAALYTISTINNLEQPMTPNIGSLVAAIDALPPPSGATALLDGIVDASKYLSEYDGRRVIVIVSDGEDTISDVETTLEKVVQSVQLKNCQVYVVKTTDFENYTKTGNRGGNANIMNLIAEHRMLEITKQTGGAVYSPLDEKELDAAFVRIAAELSQQYILSYYPEDKMLSNDYFHQIVLKVKNQPGLTVRTRKGYYVPRKR